jgi:hypothetical protein
MCRPLLRIPLMALAVATPALAGPQAEAAGATITACSTYGHHTCVTAQVRQTPLGPQFRKKGGAWNWCEGDCRDTLRRDTVDFWDDQSERNR